MSVLKLFKRTKAQIDSTPINEGQVLVATDTEYLEISVDVNNLTRKHFKIGIGIDNYASETVGGVLKVRLDGTDLHISNSNLNP